jgi:hypothetical protein
MRKLAWALATAAVMTPAMASGATITQQFTIAGSTRFPSTFARTFTIVGSSFELFNPGLGTLDEVTVTLTGSANWTSSGNLPGVLYASLFPGRQRFNAPGRIIFDISGTTAMSGVLRSLTGVGYRNAELSLSSPDHSDDMFATIGSLTGSITYRYTPAPDSDDDFGKLARPIPD